ncbi:MAG: 3-phosphoshikimate 1-carboxyvinyltransferase [Bacteroidota bacterium]
MHPAKPIGIQESAKLVCLSFKGDMLKADVALPASKSESNRALLLQKLSGGGELSNLSPANDTVLMKALLRSDDPVCDAHDAGTAFRFLTAYNAISGLERTLTGTERMCQRPIGILGDALQALGADIEYTGQAGYPPLKTKGFTWSGLKEIDVRGDVSSQYISALCMVAPLLPEGLRIHLRGHVGSRPYIYMTLALMETFGICGHFAGNMIEIPAGAYKPADYAIESDWSGAGYWFSMAALAKDTDLLLRGLRENSLQADRHIVNIAHCFGLKTMFTPEGVRVQKSGEAISCPPPQNFSDCPDLAQTVITLCAALHLPLEFCGTESLHIKETDRMAALQNELQKIGANIKEVSEGNYVLEFADKTAALPLVPEFHTYKDHRMAMAFAPVALQKTIKIDNPAVVIKSYPAFWEHLEAAGFSVD